MARNTVPPHFISRLLWRLPMLATGYAGACLAYSYANRGSNPDPSRVIKNTPDGGIFITGADNRVPALGNCPTSYCSRLRAHHSLALGYADACLAYSYANRGSNPDPPRVIKNTPDGGIFITGADNRIRTGDTWYHKPVL